MTQNKPEIKMHPRGVLNSKNKDYIRIVQDYNHCKIPPQYHSHLPSRPHNRHRRRRSIHPHTHHNCKQIIILLLKTK